MYFCRRIADTITPAVPARVFLSVEMTRRFLQELEEAYENDTGLQLEHSAYLVGSTVPEVVRVAGVQEYYSFSNVRSPSDRSDFGNRKAESRNRRKTRRSRR